MSRTLSPSSKEVPSFPSTKTSHFFSCREIENPRTGGENEHGRKIDDEARANVTRSSRFLRRSLAAQLACHKRGKDIHFNKQINEIGDTRRYEAILSKRGNTLACHRCFAFCRGGFETAQKGQCLPGAEKGEKYAVRAKLLLESALPRLNRGPSRYPTKDIFVISRGLTNVGSGLGKKGPGTGPTIYERTLNYSTGSQYSAHFYIIVYDRDRVR